MGETPWLVRGQGDRARVRLVCLPPAGGHAGLFDAWRTRLPDWIEVCAVQPPGRQSRFAQAAPRRMSQLLPALEEAVVDHVRPPYAVFGSSLGGTVAFELVRRLHRHRHPLPFRLVVCSSAAPHAARPLPTYSAMSDDRFVAEVASLGALPDEVADHPALLTTLLPALRADFELGQTYTYRPGPPVPVPVAAVRGVDDPHVPAVAVAAWSALTTGGFTATAVPGGHDLLSQVSPPLLDAVRAACGS
jgi:surfactin synthase thioesterase subunit